MLASDYPDHQRLILNICSPILRHALSCIMIRKPISEAAFSTEEYAQLACAAKSKKLKQQLLELLNVFVEHVYGEDSALYSYLAADIDNLVIRLGYFSDLYPQSSVFHF